MLWFTKNQVSRVVPLCGGIGEEISSKVTSSRQNAANRAEMNAKSQLKQE
jgi:DNA-binding transcriptional regulator LsrR (DeoR family)